VVVVRGIDRVGFRAGIEQTNIFMTGTIFFVVFCFFVGIIIALFKAFCEVAVKNGWMKSDKFQDFRNGWKIVLKGILFRLVSFNMLTVDPTSLLTRDAGPYWLPSDVCPLPLGTHTA
jgi:Transient receptor potential (TRP) ion channel